jgi:hypothetical protein
MLWFPCRYVALVDIVVGATTVAAEAFLLTLSLASLAANLSTIH